MKVPININRITDSPYSPSLREAFVIENDDLVEQVLQEIKNLHPSAYLISGYRGTGKTSFVNQVNDKLDSRTICINISLAKYDGYPKLIKKIIRQLYIEFNSLPQIGEENLLELRSELALLYDRTFYEISRQEKSQNTSEYSFENKIDLDFKKLTPLFAVLIAGLNIRFEFLKSTVANYILFILSIIWASISSWNIKLTGTKKKSDTKEQLRKSLYDDEIAEYHLFNLLQKLRDNNIPVVAAFDELDKITTTKEVDQIINELKAILLSGYANFFIVAGQGLYYHVVRATQADNPVISSIFSKTIHIPFLKYSTLKKYCIGITSDSSLVTEELYNYFFDYLISEASRVPRKLSNLIRGCLYWEQNTAYILIDETQAEFYKRESILLSVTTRMLDNDLPKITANGALLDFFIAQIHLWLNAIRHYRSNEFTIEQIVEKDSYCKDEYPSSYISQLESICELFFDKLIEEKILKSRKAADDITYYSWVTENESENVAINDMSDLKDADFIQEYTEFEQYIRGIYVDLVDDYKHDSPQIPVKQMIYNLTELGVLEQSWSTSTALSRITETRNKVVHGMTIDHADLNIIQNSRFDIGRLKAELIEAYTFYVCKKHLTRYEVIKQNRGGFDFIAIHEEISIAFDVKYLQFGRQDSRNANDIIDKFTNYLQTVNQNSFYVLFFYQPNGRKSYDEFYSKFYDIVRNEVPSLSHRFYLFYTSEYRGDANSGKLQAYLNQILDKIEKAENQKPFTDETTSKDEYADAEEVIKTKSKIDWPDNFTMQNHQIGREIEAVRQLQATPPTDIPANIFRSIKDKAAIDWPDNFGMRLHQQSEQIESYRSLHR